MQDQILQIISLGAIIILLGNVLFLITELCGYKNPCKQFILKFQLQILSIVSLGGVLGSIFLSTYFKLLPCELCWYQRVFLFSLPIIALIGLYKKDSMSRLYIFVLSTIGSLIALYHSLIQSKIFTADSVFCNPDTSAIDCSVAAFTYFGFVTIPVISLSVFTLLMILSYGYKQK